MADNSDDPDLQQQIFDAYQRLVIENYCIIASSALLFFDYAITFTTEVQRIWHRRFTGATTVFLFTRYVALAERITLLVSLFLITTADKSCVPVLRLDDILTDLNYVAFGAFTALRLFGIYGKAWPPLLAIGMIWAARVTIAIYLQINYIPLAFGPPLYGCGAIFKPAPGMVYRLQNAANALLIASDTLLLVLTWVKTVGIRRESIRLGISAPLATLLLRDGTIYFVLILIIQIVAIVSVDVGSGFILFDVWTYFAQVIIVIFLSRFMLNLRGVYLTDETEITVPHFTSNLHFASNVVGNLGAPLDISMSITASTTLRPSNDYDYDDSQEIEEESGNPLLAGLEKQPEEIEMD